MRSLRHLLLAASFLAAPAVHGGQDSGPIIIEHGPRDSKKIALTFDACPTTHENEFDERVIEILWAEKVPATLFLSGRWVEKNADITKFLAEQPQFEIGNHAFWHPHLLEKDDERVLRELRRTQDIILRVAGMRPKYFRPPFGEVDERVARLAAQAGLVTIQYDIASGDPDPALPVERIARSVAAKAKGGSIVVFHMNRNGPLTAEALPVVIKGLREKGFELVTVGELLRTRDKGNGRQGDKEKRRERAGGEQSTGKKNDL